MATVVHNAPNSSAYAVPPTQNTAPVHEFRCLYTHDVRRKAKRWQDGFLRFHTFNKRVMVYDVQRNFIGDMHRQEGSGAIQDGDELSLDRGGILVEVGEPNGTVEQDLSGLLAKRVAKPVEKGTNRRGERVGQELLQRSSNMSPQTPGSRIGRAAVPQVSPFENRRVQADEQDWEQGPSTKRQRRDDNHVPLWEILKTSKPSRPPISNVKNISLHTGLSAATPKVASISKLLVKERQPIGQTRLKVKETIDLTSSLGTPVEQDDTDRPTRSPLIVPAGTEHGIAATDKSQPRSHHGTDQTPSRSERLSERTEGEVLFTPARVSRKPAEASVLTRPTSKPHAQSAELPNGQATPLHSKRSEKLPSKHNHVEHNVAKHYPQDPPMQPLKPPLIKAPLTRIRTSSPPVSTTNHLPSPIEHEIIRAVDVQETATASGTLSEPKRAMKTLRLSRAAKKTLLCQTMMYPKVHGSLNPPEHDATEGARRTGRKPGQSPSRARSASLQRQPEHLPSVAKPPSPKQVGPLPSHAHTASPRQRDKPASRRNTTTFFVDDSDSEPAFETAVESAELVGRTTTRISTVRPMISALEQPEQSPLRRDPPTRSPSTAEDMTTGPNPTRELTSPEIVQPIDEAIVIPANQPDEVSDEDTRMGAITEELVQSTRTHLSLGLATKPVISAMRAVLKRASTEAVTDRFRPPAQSIQGRSKLRAEAAEQIATNYSHLDAKLLSEADRQSMAVNASQQALSNPLVSEIAESTALALARPAPRPPNPQFKALSISKVLSRSFTRHQSINAPTSNPLKKRDSNGLQRAETLPINPSRDGSTLSETGVDAVAQLEYGEGLGPWSREAWDLFGCAPPGRSDASVYTVDEVF